MNTCRECGNRTDLCNWKLNSSENTYWITSCGQDFWYDHENPIPEFVNFCQHCGGKVVDVTNYCTRCNWVIDEPGMCGSCEDTVADFVHDIVERSEQPLTNRSPEEV